MQGELRTNFPVTSLNLYIQRFLEVSSFYVYAVT